MKSTYLTRLALLATLPVGAISSSLAATDKADSSSEYPYLLPAQPSVFIKSLMTVGDAVSYKPHTAIPYRMVGIPDGLGAFDNDGEGDENDCDRDYKGERENRGTFTLLMNQELVSNVGVARDHGFTGAFISKWVIDKKTLTVLKGEDLIKTAHRWDNATQSYQPLTGGFTRFCSGDLPVKSAFYNKKTKLGYNGRIYMNGEESGSEGRAFAHFMDGNSFELPALGKLAFENCVANPGTGDKTIVSGTDDGTGGQVYIYTGVKSASTDSLEAAGLKNGILTAIKVDGLAIENDATTFTTGPFSVVSLGDVSALTGAQLETATQAAGATTFARPEDSCWDPRNPNDLYFVTTASFTGNSRLWKMSFVDAAQPQLGGTATVLLDGTTGPKMMDNLTISKNGTMLIQEDVGNQDHLGKIWRYSISSGALDIIAEHDPALFAPGAADFLTRDEESSGIIPMDDILGEGWFLCDVQAHYNAGDAELVEGGQLVALRLTKERSRK